jgi:hypothetical protein
MFQIKDIFVASTASKIFDERPDFKLYKEYCVFMCVFNFGNFEINL